MENKMPTIALTIREAKGKTIFRDKEYFKYLVNDSYGHYFTKLLTKEYKAGDKVEFTLRTYKGQLSIKAVE